MLDLLCALPLISALLSHCGPPPPLATGYVEGEYVQVAPLVTARVNALSVGRGDRVGPGDPLAEVESADAQGALDAAEARLAQAEAQLADLGQGSRPEELAALEATVAAARASAARAARDAEREAQLSARGAAPRAQSDDLSAASEVAAATLAEAEARLAVARLPARADRITAARAAVAEARAARDTSRWQLDQRRIQAEGAGVVTDIIRTPGDIAGPTAPILTYLPDGAVRLRVFVPQASLASISVGGVLQVACDGCEPQTARITWIADQAEFTPPVIYSRDSRQKLVYMVEAAPETPTALKPGQIVEVRLAP